MLELHFPVRPDVARLEAESRELASAAGATLEDARHELARSYGLPSWDRLVVACRMTDAIWRDDREAVRELVTKTPELL